MAASSKDLILSLLTTLPSGVSPPAAPPPPNAAEAAALDQFIAHFSDPSLSYPASSEACADAPLSPLTHWEKCSLLSKEAMLRCLRADRLDVPKAIRRLEGTLAWRRSCGTAGQDFAAGPAGPRELLDMARREGATGKLFVLGFDGEARPVLHMRPRLQNQCEGPDVRMKFTYWTIDRVLDLLPRYQEKMTIMTDTSGKAEKPSLSQQMDFIKVLSHHYCERLGKAALLHMNILFQYMIRFLKPFMEQVTYDKIVADTKKGLALVPAEHRDQCLEGTSPFVWDSEAYWSTLIEECARRREAKIQKWRAEGSRIGLSEWDDQHWPLPAAQQGEVTAAGSGAATPVVAEKQAQGEEPAAPAPAVAP